MPEKIHRGGTLDPRFPFSSYPSAYIIYWYTLLLIQNYIIIRDFIQVNSLQSKLKAAKHNHVESAKKPNNIYSFVESRVDTGQPGQFQSE